MAPIAQVRPSCFSVWFYSQSGSIKGTRECNSKLDRITWICAVIMIHNGSRLVTPVLLLNKLANGNASSLKDPCLDDTWSYCNTDSSTEQFYFSRQPPSLPLVAAIRDQHENKRPWDRAYIPLLCGSVRFIYFHKSGPKMSGSGPEIPSLCLDNIQENNVLS